MNMYVGPYKGVLNSEGKLQTMPETDDQGGQFVYRPGHDTRVMTHHFTPGSPIGKYSVIDQQHDHSVAPRYVIKRVEPDGYQIEQVEGPKRLDAPRIHELKVDAHNLDALLSGRKKCEIRDNDRQFKVGEFLFLRETQRTNIEMRAHGLPLSYTGRVALFEVTHIQTGYGLPSWLVALSVNELARRV